MNLPVILHIPHSSLDIPAPYDSDILLSAADLEREKIKLTDMHTHELYVLEDAERAVFPVSRFLVDAERFDNDAQEPMAARGMGAIYTITTDLKPLRAKPTAQQRAEIMAKYYHPHHERLNTWADNALKTAGRGLLLDCHSFPSKVLPYELEVNPRQRPEICIGTDSFHTPPALASAVVESFKAAGYEVGLDSPFAGTLTPGRHYGRSQNIFALMIEVRKDLYMDELTGAKLERFNSVRNDVTSAMENAVKSIV